MMLETVSTGVCPKCGFERREEESCGRCGIIYAKYRSVSPAPERSVIASGYSLGWLGIAKKCLIEADESSDYLAFSGRAVLFVFLVWWAVAFIARPLEANYAGESFLHVINLPFHEAGHIFFMPFGRFMMFLGGSLGQVLIPLLCLATFLFKTRDLFGASVALWWTAENFMDLAPYINDARARDLVLLGGVTGKETDGHDWENILGMLGWLHYDHFLAHLSHNLGIFLMILSLVWGAALLLHHYRRL